VARCACVCATWVWKHPREAEESDSMARDCLHNPLQSTTLDARTPQGVDCRHGRTSSDRPAPPTFPLDGAAAPPPPSSGPSALGAACACLAAPGTLNNCTARTHLQRMERRRGHNRSSEACTAHTRTHTHTHNLLGRNPSALKG